MFGKKKQEMPLELFNQLDKGLREIFKTHCIENNTLEKPFHDSTYGLAGAQAAQALIELHRDFKPKG